MKDTKLEQEVKHYYLGQNISPETMEELLQLTHKAKNKKEKPQTPWYSSKVNLAMAASFTAILFTAIQFVYIFKSSESDLILRVAQEVALNHNKNLATEFGANNYADLSMTMDKLDFDLKAPRRISMASFNVLGARYCSIQGEIAGQIKLQDNAGEILTLYVTKSNDALATLHNRVQERDSLLISNWQEDSLFFSLATPK